MHISPVLGGLLLRPVPDCSVQGDVQTQLGLGCLRASSSLRETDRTNASDSKVNAVALARFSAGLI